MNLTYSNIFEYSNIWIYSNFLLQFWYYSQWISLDDLTNFEYSNIYSIFIFVTVFLQFWSYSHLSCCLIKLCHCYFFLLNTLNVLPYKIIVFLKICCYFLSLSYFWKFVVRFLSLWVLMSRQICQVLVIEHLDWTAVSLLGLLGLFSNVSFDVHPLSFIRNVAKRQLVSLFPGFKSVP